MRCAESKLRCSVTFPQSVMPSVGADALRFVRSKVSVGVYQEILELFTLPFADWHLPTLPRVPTPG